MTDMATSERGCLAFLAAPVAAALAAAIAFAPWMAGGWADFPDMAALFGATFLIALVVAAMHVFILAAPLYYWLDRHFRPNLAVILAAGGLIGALPALLLVLLTGGGEALQGILAFGLFGVVGAFAFWAVLRPDRR